MLELEQRVAAGLGAACDLVVQAGMEQERRSLRSAVRDLGWRRDAEAADSIIVEFRLSRGAYATTVLRELFAADADYDESNT